MATDTALLLKQYRDLARNIESFSDGQAKLKDRDENDDCSLDVICVTLAPKAGLYRGGKFDFELDVSSEYPACPPVVHCMTQIYHPNIDFSDESGEVCLNLLDELWTSNMTLEDVVQGLLFLLQHPNIEDPLSCLFSGSEDEEEFKRNVRRALKGEDVDGVPFERNLDASFEEYDDEDNDGRDSTTGDGVELVEGDESMVVGIEAVKQEPTAKAGNESVQTNVESSVDRSDFTTFLGDSGSGTIHILVKSISNILMRVGFHGDRTDVVESSVDPVR